VVEEDIARGRTTKGRMMKERAAKEKNGELDKAGIALTWI
jgi:hypothetical protein